MSLQIRRGTEAQRSPSPGNGVVFDLGELIYTTDSKKLYVGDGSTAGGVNILASSAGTGLTWNSTTQTLNFSGTLSGYTTDNLAQGTVNLYYTPTRAKADIATMFTATGSATVTGTVTATTATTISFVGAVSTVNSTGILTYTSGTVPQIGMVITGTGINASPATYIVSGTSPTFILNQVPTTPGTGVAIQGAISLVSVGSATGLVALEPFIVTGTGGGGLTAATYYIINPTAGSNQISLATSLANAQNSVAITTLTTASLSTTSFTAGGPDSNITFSYNPVTSTMSINSAASGITSVQQDVSPRLGGDLVLNSKNITGTGSINITGNIQASGTLQAGATTLTTVGASTVTATTLSTAAIAVPDASQGLQIATKSGNSFSINYYNGTAGSPTAMAIGGGGMVMSLKGYTGSVYQFAGGVGAQWDVGANLTDSQPKSSVALIAGSGGAGTYLALLNSSGIFSAPALQTGTYATGTYPAGGTVTTIAGLVIGASGTFTCTSTTLTLGGQVTISGTNTGTGVVANGTYYITVTNGTTSFTLSATGNGSPISTTAGTVVGLTTTVQLPQKGMIIFDSTVNHFYGYNGTNWVQFTGP